MDRIDRKILSLFQNDTRRIAEDIGAEVGLSAAAVQRRLKKLREDRVIRAEIAVLDNATVGAPITCIVALSLKSRPSYLDQFKQEMRAQPQVQQVYHVTGSIDFVLILTARSMEDYAAFARTHFESNSEIARYETHVALDRAKVGLSVPISDDP